jgi:hypothetical protein
MLQAHVNVYIFTYNYYIFYIRFSNVVETFENISANNSVDKI